MIRRYRVSIEVDTAGGPTQRPMTVDLQGEVDVSPAEDPKIVAMLALSHASSLIVDIEPQAEGH